MRVKMLDKQTEDILYQCSHSTRMIAKTFFPERFWAPFAENVHGEIFKRVDNASNKVCIAAPRGWGKTSIVAEALMARYIMFKLCPFIVYITKSETAAIYQTENLKRELVSNKTIRAFFGSVRTRTASHNEIEEQFSKKAWVAYDTFILPRGAGQQVRGLLFKNDRPGLIVIDDLEDKKKVLNEDLRRELKEWFYADVLECIPQLHMNWKIIYIDTLKHEDALLQHLLTSQDWDSIRLESCDDNFHSTAPHFVSDEVIKAKWDIAVRAGETDTFFQEHRNLPISSKDSAFQPSYFHYYNLSNNQNLRESDLPLFDAEVQNDQNIETVIILDPAKTVKVHSAESAIIGIGIDLTNARLYIRDAISRKMYPDEIYNALFGMAQMLGAKVIGIEDTSLNEFIRQPIKNEMFKRGSFYELIWLKARGGMKKELRIKELVPYYRTGYVYHNASCPGIKQLEQQLLMFPRSALWDLMDAEAYIVEMLELGERYFSPKDNPEDSEAEYNELTYEKPIEDWRAV
jgi:predicted phage terminase large subunit-like protein